METGIFPLIINIKWYFEEIRDTGKAMAAYSVVTLWQSFVQRQTDREGRGLLSTHLSGRTADMSTKKAAPCVLIKMYKKATGNGVKRDEKEGKTVA